MEKVLAFVRDAKVVFVIPLPRYVLSGCCADPEHVSNHLSGELAAEFAGAEKSLRDAADLGEKTGKARLLNILSFFGSCESLPQDLTTVDGTSIWAGDGVHLTSNASRVAARRLMADLAKGGEEGEPATGNQENAAGINRADRRASQEKSPGRGAAACDAAQTRSAADAALAVRPAAAAPEGARIRTPHQQPEGRRWADTR
jgi:hypothetical protein